MGYLFGASWRSFVLACGLPNVLLLLGRFAWRWESPRHLLVKGRVEEVFREWRETADQAKRVIDAHEEERQRTLERWMADYEAVWQSAYDATASGTPGTVIGFDDVTR